MDAPLNYTAEVPKGCIISGMLKYSQDGLLHVPTYIDTRYRHNGLYLIICKIPSSITPPYPVILPTMCVENRVAREETRLRVMLHLYICANTALVRQGHNETIGKALLLYLRDLANAELAHQRCVKAANVIQARWRRVCAVRALVESTGVSFDCAERVVIM